MYQATYIIHRGGSFHEIYKFITYANHINPNRISDISSTDRTKSNCKMYLLQPLLTFLLLTLTTSTPIPTLTHDATAVINDLTKITTDLSALAKSIVAYNGGIPAALDIQVKEMAVERDLDQATRDTTAATPFTVSESATTTSALLGLEPDIRTALVTLVQKVFPFLLFLGSMLFLKTPRR
ncbi:hypothetical protein Ao3042_09460 [Aspergillus oryzae 3.042]|uniref:Cell wall galactomannoprotein n=1 Tax=Aspergillus oryzae (strain 3.042) TaxID=1160506 RepID=I7ZRQ2_ASPO3|nr:hypothetical protein Ao3042_09460 [Aspergillus oryzae 3.042]|eukprot:EIT74552.1 hypothetical protein Ao3042_09460 [Aspergillus oryzae 3.042]